MWKTWFVAAAFALSVAADAAWKFTLPNHSPTIAYEPYSDGVDPEKGWTIWTSANGYLDEASQDANGDIRHLSSHAGGSFAFEFYGTAVTLHGEANATYGITVDGTTGDVHSGDSILFSSDGLALGMHKLKLTLKDTSRNKMVIFWDAVITSSSPTALTTTTYPSYDPKLKYTGKWETLDIEEGRFKTSASRDATVSFTFTGARAAAIHSHINWGLWTFAIDLDGTLIDPPTSRQFNASSFWLIRDTIMYFVDNLDSTKNHTLTLINLAAESYEYTAITNFEIWRVDPAAIVTGSRTDTSPAGATSTGSTPVSSDTSGSSGLSSGAYAGIAIGVLAVVAAIAAFIWLMFRRKTPVNQPDVHWEQDSGPASRWTQDTTPEATLAAGAAALTGKAGRMGSPVTTSPTIAEEEEVDAGQLPVRHFMHPPPAYPASATSGSRV